jgi:long-chain acyl-CoA synthetase
LCDKSLLPPLDSAYLGVVDRTTDPAISSMNSITASFEASVSSHAKRIALKGDGGVGQTYTYAELLDEIHAVAGGLSREKYQDQVEIGLISENRPEWVIAYLAILAAGKTVVPVDANLKPNEIDYIISHAGIEMLFCSGRFEPVLADLSKDLQLFSFDENSSRSWNLLRRPAAPMVDFPPRDIAVLIYTSGTTGAPKAVELTHRNLLSNVEGIISAVPVEQEDVLISVLPLHHTFEATVGFLIPMMRGASIVYARSLNSRDIVEDIKRNQATIMCGVPLLYEKMYQSFKRKLQSAPFISRMIFRLLYGISSIGWRLGLKWGRSCFGRLREKAGLGSIRLFVSGGAATPLNIQRFFNLIGFDFTQGYGLTETAPVLSTHRPNDIRFGSVGPPLDNVEIRITEPDSKGIGPIVVRGPNVTPGYRGNPEGTAELIRDGWLHTGDLGRLRKGHLWITGRAKNVIVSAAGKNIYPEELEERLVDSRFILEAVVFGRARKGKQGEDVRTIVVPDLEQLRAELGIDMDNPDREKIGDLLKSVVDEINNQIAGYKRIVGFDFQFDELEKTSTKKIKRFVYH